MPNNQQILEEWYKRVSVTQLAHYRSASHFGRRNYWLGIPSVILATVVGTTVFATLAKTPDVLTQIAVGIASVTAAVLTSLQTFLGYSERSEKHRLAGAKYGALGREMEILRAKGDEVGSSDLEKIGECLKSLAIESPNNPETIYRKAGSGSLEAPDKAASVA